MPLAHLFLLLLALLTAAASGGVWAQAAQLTSATTSLSLRPFVEVLEDADGSLNIADVERPDIAARFRPVAGRGELNFGYSDATYWLRVRLLAPPGAPSSWRLEVDQPSLDYLTFFLRHNSGFARLDGGDRTAFAARPYAHRNFVFPLVLSPGGEQSLYLRVASEGNVHIPLTLWAPHALLANDQASYSLLAAYLGGLLALAIYHLLPGCAPYPSPDLRWTP